MKVFVPVICDATAETCSLPIRTLAPDQTSPVQGLAVQCSVTGICGSRVLYFKPIPGHAILVFPDQTFTIFLRIVGPAKQHTLVAGGFLVLADAARLEE